MDSHRRGARVASDHGAVIVIRRTGIDTPPEVTSMRVGRRRTAHVRHLHKYTAARLPPNRRFYFRNGADRPTGAPAANMAEFHSEVAQCGPDVIRHHAKGRDFSRWIALALGDLEMAAIVEALETRADENGPDHVTVETARNDILRAVEQRYIGEDLRPFSGRPDLPSIQDGSA